MDLPTPAPAASTVRLSASDESADRQRLQETLAKADFKDWPNEAGFDGLTEQRGPIELTVRGSIPAWAAGSLYRTGPGGCKVENTSKGGTFYISHWFDGLAHTHRFDILPVDDSSENHASGGSNGHAVNGDARRPAVRVEYSSRLQSEGFMNEIRAAGTIRCISFGQRADPCVGMFAKFMTMFTRPHRYENIGVTVNADMAGVAHLTKAAKGKEAATNGVKRGHRTALPSTVVIGTDTNWLNEVDPQTMESLGYISHSDLNPELKGPMGVAHGHTDPETGDYINVNIEFGRSATYRVFSCSASTGKTTVLATFQSKPAYLHSFFMTKNYVVVCIPVAHLALAGIKAVWEGSILEAFKPFDKTETCRWFVIDRRGGRGVLAEFASPAGFFFHSVNAFEEEAQDGDILCDLVSYRSSKIVTHFYYDVLLNRDGAGQKAWNGNALDGDCHASLVRFRFRKDDFDPQTAAAKQARSQSRGRGALPSPQLELEISAPHVGELPTINPAYQGREQRFVYSMVTRGQSTLFDGIGKTDLRTRDVLIWSGPRGHTPGEAIFVQRPAAAAGGEPLDEDDGVLLSVVLDGENRTSYLLCLDAKTMTELGRAECEFAVGHGFHGSHVRGSL